MNKMMTVAEIEKVKAALVEESKSNGHDFGVLEFVTKPAGMNKQAFGGYVTALQKEGFLKVYGTEKIDGRNVTQYVIESLKD